MEARLAKYVVPLGSTLLDAIEVIKHNRSRCAVVTSGGDGGRVCSARETSCRRCCTMRTCMRRSMVSSITISSIPVEARFAEGARPDAPFRRDLDPDRRQPAGVRRRDHDGRRARRGDARRRRLNGAFMAVIPARGGSKRAPRKNIRPLGNRPLLAYTIAAAIEAGLGDATLVSTEDAEIAAVATRLGCRVLQRPTRSRPMPPRPRAFCCTRSTRRRRQGWHPEWILTLPPTSPFRRAAQSASSWIKPPMPASTACFR